VPPVPVGAQVVQAPVIAEKPLGELAVVREYYTSHSLGPESSGVSVLSAACEEPNEVPIAGGFTVTNSSDNNRLRIYGSMPNLTSSAWQVIAESVDDRSTQNVIVGVNVLCLQQQQQQQNNTTTASPVTLEDDDEEATITSSADDDTDDDNSGDYDNGNGVDDDDGGDNSCHPSYPDDCIPSAPPVLTCDDISARNFQVVGSDPHGFDGDNDGIGCESGSGSNAPDDYVDDGGEEDVDDNESNYDDDDNDNDDGGSSSSGGSTTTTTDDDEEEVVEEEDDEEEEEPETPQGDEVDEGPIENIDDSAGDGGNNDGTSSDS
jgi:hypothetical protein